MNDAEQTEVEQHALAIHTISVRSRTSAETRFQIPKMQMALATVAKECKQALSQLGVDAVAVNSSLEKIREVTAPYDAPEAVDNKQTVKRKTNVK